jgi:hypothetical protein
MAVKGSRVLAFDGANAGHRESQHELRVWGQSILRLSINPMIL